MILNKSFILISSTGEEFFPYIKPQKSTGRKGYACTTPEHGKDRKGGGYYTNDIREVIEGVILKGWGVRAKKAKEALKPGENNSGSSLKFGKDSIEQYWVAPEYRGIVSGGSKAPLEHLPGLATWT